MNRTNQILGGLLIVQIIIAVIVLLPRSNQTASGGALLADFQPESVTGLVIQNQAGDRLELSKNADGDWILPEYDDFPGDLIRINALLNNIAGLRADRLIAQNPSSHRRLGVAEDEFEAMIEIRQGDRTNRLFIGTSGGSNATHTRLDGQNQVYLTSGLASWQANPQISSWVDTSYFSVPASDISALTLQNANGTFEFRKEDDTWVMLGLQEGETFNPDSLTPLLNQAASIRLERPLGRAEQPEYGMEEPRAIVTLTTRTTPEDATDPVETSYSLRFGAALDNQGSVLLASTSEYHVLVTNFAANTFIDKNRDNFLIASE